MNKRKNRRKIALIVIASVIIILFAALIGPYVMFRDELNAAKSIKKLDEDLWYMEYKGDYGFDGFIDGGGAVSDNEMAEYIVQFLSKGFYRTEFGEDIDTVFSCSTIAAQNRAGEYICGRNFDWDDCRGIIVKTEPKNGYASISTANLDFLGFDDGYTPNGSFADKFMTLAAVYVPLDGMNEKGLCVADLVVGDGELGETHQNTELPDLTTVSAIRLILDRAATVDEAVELLRGFDMNSSAGMMHHLSISDASGKSIAVEYPNGEMTVTETQEVTNFYLSNGEYYGLGGDSCKSLERYNMLKDLYIAKGGVLETGEIKDALISVSCGALNRGTTQWSIVYNKNSLTLEMWFKEDYDNSYTFIIKND